MLIYTQRSEIDQNPFRRIPRRTFKEKSMKFLGYSAIAAGYSQLPSATAAIGVTIVVLLALSLAYVVGRRHGVASTVRLRSR